MRSGGRPPAPGCPTSARATPDLGPQPCLAASERRRRRCSANGSLQQQDMTHQQQNLTAEASAKRQRGKHERSVDASSSNPSASASHKSLASKDFKAKEGEIRSSAAKQKIPKWKRSRAKRSRSQVVSTGNLRSSQLISVLFETPSGFAIFNMLEEDLKGPDAMQDVWANFGADYRVEDFIWLKEFREFKDKSCVINQDTGVSLDLAEMIKSCHVPGWKIAVGKAEYKVIIEKSLGIPCLCDGIVMEVMWGLKHLMHFLVPQEKIKLRNVDRLPMSQGLKMILNRHGFDVKPEMVNDDIILAACILLDCEYCDVKNSKPLRVAGEHIKDVSGIKSEGWDLMKLATAVKIICYPADATITEKKKFTRDEVLKFEKDAHKYEDRFNKGICLNVYNEMVEAREITRSIHRALETLPEMHQPIE
ncbi:unnamed protein product [Urochloa decumbens]|uniref:Uncharacterized protein n=1 Tax=Urochloa decumbens TaxID=240449 RepID=A0ABC9F5J0_9POAL